MIDRKTISPMEAQAIDADASVLMKRGIRLMHGTTPEAVTDALGCFDAALELRTRLPIDEVPVFRYGLAACWLNRAEALVRLGGEVQLTAALRACDAGIALLRVLPLADDSRFLRRLAMALQNRGLVLQLQGGDAGEAVTALTEAVAILNDERSAQIPDRQYLLATVWLNLAIAHASDSAVESGRLAPEAARRAIALARGREETDGDAAEVGLKARHVLCQSLAAPLSPAIDQDPALIDTVHEATDQADEGLGLARRWEQKGVIRFRGLAYDLFRFGARVYALHQPQFLHEFIADNMDPAHSSVAYVESPEMQAAAREALGLSAGVS